MQLRFVEVIAAEVIQRVSKRFIKLERPVGKPRYLRFKTFLSA